MSIGPTVPLQNFPLMKQHTKDVSLLEISMPTPPH